MFIVLFFLLICLGNWGFHSEFGTYFKTELAFSSSCHQSNPHPRIRIFWGFVGTFSRNFSQNMTDFLKEWCFLSPNYPHFKIKIPTKPINTGVVRILHYSNSSRGFYRQLINADISCIFGTSISHNIALFTLFLILLVAN